MADSASDARSSEQELRQKLIEARAVRFCHLCVPGTQTTRGKP